MKATRKKPGRSRGGVSGGMRSLSIKWKMFTRSSTLFSMGVPVTGLNPGGHVVADLMLSEDGTPQAIRLVSQANQVQE